MERTVCIGVVSHKPYIMPKDDCYLPIWVGPNDNCPVGYCSHAEGDSIASLNSSYCELTGLYWLWKNVNAQYKGLAHYRRILASCPTKKIEQVLNSDDYISALHNADVLTAVAKRYPLATVQSHYINSKKCYQNIHEDDISALKQAMKSAGMDYCKVLDGVLNGHKAHMLNIFCMREDMFDSYCSWLFNVVDVFYSLRSQRIDQKRFVGAMSEFLLDVWVLRNGLTLLESPLYQPEVSGLRRVHSLLLER